MSVWLDKVTGNPGSIEPVVEAYDFFTTEYEVVKGEIALDRIVGTSLIELARRVPGLAEHVYAQFATIKAITEVLETRILAETQKARRFYGESYNRALSYQQVEKYCTAAEPVLALRDLVTCLNEVKEKWAGLSKGVENLHYQVRNIAEIRRAGLDDMVF